MSQPDKSLPGPIARVAPDGVLTPRRRRRILIEMSLRRQKPGTGSSYEFLHRRTAMHIWPDLRAVLEGIPWAITGGGAPRAYMPERATLDLDIVVLRRDCRAVWERLRDAGYQVAQALDAPYFVARSPEGVEVDVICADFPWLSQALASPHSDPAGYPVLALPYLILMKLRANRGVDIGDMTRMLGLASEQQLQAVREAVSRHSPEDLEDLESLIILGKREMEPPEGKQWWQ